MIRSYETTSRVSKLIQGLGSDDALKRKEADQHLENICFQSTRPGASSEQSAVAKTLAAALDQQDLPVLAKKWVVRRLGQIGQYECVKALERLLDDSSHGELRDAARRALEANPTVPALRALRKALEKAEGDFKVAIMHSLSQRRDLLSVGPILELARGEKSKLKLLALTALAEIGERSGLDAIEQSLKNASGDDRDTLLAIYVRFAWRLRENDEGGAARRIFIHLMEVGGRWKIAGLIGIGKTGIPSEVPAVMKALGDKNAEVRQAALEALHSLRGATPAIVASLDTSSPELQAELIHALGNRRDARKSKPVIEALQKTARSPRDSVRLATIQAIVDLERSDGKSILNSLLSVKSEEVRGAARRALSE